MKERICFLRDENRFPVACIAVSFDREEKKVSYALSIHNPKDNFDRKIARKVALGRLNKRPIFLQLKEDPTSCHQITRAVVEALISTQTNENYFQMRVLPAARGWIDYADKQKK